MPVFEPVVVLRPSAASSLTVGSCSCFMVGLALKPTAGSFSLNHSCCLWAAGGEGSRVLQSHRVPGHWLCHPCGSDEPVSALCAGNYNLTSMLPTAPDMAQFKQGVRSVAGKLSVFANGVMTSIQVSETGMTLTEFDGGFIVLKMRFGPLFNCWKVRFYIIDLYVCYSVTQDTMKTRNYNFIFV